MPTTKVTFNVRLYLSEPLDNGTFPVVLQIYWRDTKAKLRRKRLGFSCSPDEFDTDSDRIKRSVWGANKLNAEIDAAVGRAIQIYKQNFSDKPWDYRLWAEHFDHKEQDGIMLDSFGIQHIKKHFSMVGPVGFEPIPIAIGKRIMSPILTQIIQTHIAFMHKLCTLYADYKCHIQCQTLSV